ncbi:protein FAR1-RELATED SEQUENCE 6-like [Mercurialis annua]|uniref:protein FAR1-RELATED SEQUENCE 6-like n=1 Tax=Mercurialis annua TaxID=3986 RepID=UPI0024AE2DFC|nr:protein FAR1-RELATED SEQUENCE 6-like [Mercurialis annua]
MCGGWSFRVCGGSSLREKGFENKIIVQLEVIFILDESHNRSVLRDTTYTKNRAQKERWRRVFRHFLARRRVLDHEDRFCLHCDEVETGNHIVIYCHVAWKFWTDFLAKFGVMAWSIPGDISSFYYQWMGLANHKYRKLWVTVWFSIWEICKARNKLIFRDEVTSSKNLFFHCIDKGVIHYKYHNPHFIYGGNDVFRKQHYYSIIPTCQLVEQKELRKLCNPKCDSHFPSNRQLGFNSASLIPTPIPASPGLAEWIAMEEICLNNEPSFDEGNEYEVEEDCGVAEEDNGTIGSFSRKEPLPPTIGLEFDSFNEAYDSYNVYAKDQGFGIRVSNSWFRSKRKERYRAKLSCSSAGFKKKSEANNPRPETRTGCPAMIVIRLVDSERWRIVEVELGHNHSVSPQIKRFYKSHKKMIVAARKAQPPPDPVTEVHTIKLYRTAVDPCNEYLSIDKGGEGASVNCVDHSKHLELKEGDAHALYNYFCRMKLTNPNFFYLMDFDDDGRLRNVFWAGARSRSAYGYFCDTVAIDTTCLANKSEIPLISFVGVNHHGQSILLGCGFLGHESVECFSWIFRAWLKCMQGRPPEVIITDQCKPLQNAVSEVFPQARHSYSLWYIMQRLPEKLGGLKGFEGIKERLNKAVYNSLKIAEFETSWNELIRCHGLTDNKWLQTLYEERERWVPVYLKDISFAGMIPITENESCSAFFDGYVHKHTSFKEFVDKYDLALHRKHLKEAMADMESRKSSFELKTRCNFEVQLSKVYTKEIFKKFQSEVEHMYSCFNTRQVSVNGPIMTYIVKERVEVEGNEKEVKHFEVLYETSQVDIRCICSLFNYKGYLCRHALNVLNYNGVEEIPSRYILPRWCKDFKGLCVSDNGSCDIDMYNPVYWSSHLYKRGVPIVEEGSQLPDRYRIASQELEDLLSKLNIMEN